MQVGRPSSYKPEFCDTARVVCELGGIDRDVAEALNIDISTLYRWRNKYPDFCDSLKAGKAPADERVKASLLHRAVGYSHEEDDIRVVGGQVVVTPTIKHYPPDTTACIFWLKNRLPAEFRANPDESPQESADRIIEVIRATKPNNENRAD